MSEMTIREQHQCMKYFAEHGPRAAALLCLIVELVRPLDLPDDQLRVIADRMEEACKLPAQ